MQLPASFVAHTDDRGDQNLIASQMADQDFDVIIGGGLKYFLPKNILGNRDDNIDLTQKLIDKGYSLPKNYTELKSIPDSVKQIYALFEMDGLPEASKRNYTLGDLTKSAIDHLKNNENGFILMVEGSQIDWAGHDHKSKELLLEMHDFSTALNEAIKFC